MARLYVWLWNCQPRSSSIILVRLICQYPSYPKINENIKIEAEAVVRRLRNHPSVVIFAGNNEDYQIAEAEGAIDYSDESGDYMKTAFPA
jgi:beta-mannosidase